MLTLCIMALSRWLHVCDSDSSTFFLAAAVRAHCRTGPMVELWDMGEAFDVEDETEEFDEGVSTEAENAMTVIMKVLVEKVGLLFSLLFTCYFPPQRAWSTSSRRPPFAASVVVGWLDEREREALAD